MTLYRSAAFLMKGMKEFTQSGYLAASKNFNPQDLEIDITNRSFMVTGANSGIGFSTSLELAKRGGTVHMVCRSQDRGEKAQKQVMEESNNQKVHLHLVDMSDLHRVYGFAKEFVDKGEELHVLVNNAGCMLHEKQISEEGIEKNFATNTLGVYLLTETLIPLLQKSQDSRVITVSSGGMYTQKLDLKNLQSEKGSFDGRSAYAHQKRQQVILTEEWVKRYPEIHFYSMHPGWADTQAVREAMPGFYNSLKNKLRQADGGADTVVWLSIAQNPLTQPNGGFYLDRAPQDKHLRWASTRSSEEDRNKFMSILGDLSDKFRSAKTGEVPSRE